MNYFNAKDLFQITCALCFSRTEKRFEQDFASYLGVKHSISTSFGRTALYLALDSIDVRNMEVILPNFTCTVVKQAVQTSGAIPVYVNINKDNFNFDIEDLTSKINANTKAVILTHYYGTIARNFSEIISIASEHNLILIEDCAHSIGGKYKGKNIGTIGHIGVFSLTKSLFNFGGGVLVTNDNKIYKSALHTINNSSTSLENRICDGFTILSHGIEQFFTKLFLERSFYFPFKFKLLKIAKWPFLLRSLTFFPFINLLRMLFKNVVKSSKLNSRKFFSYSPHYHGLKMSKLIAAIAIVQLRHVDDFRKNRQKIYKKLNDNSNASKRLPIFEIEPNEAFSFITLLDPSISAHKLSCLFQNKYLLLKTTWPNRQSFDSYRFTPDLIYLKNHMLTITLHPGFSDSDIKIILETFHDYQRESYGFIPTDL